MNSLKYLVFMTQLGLGVVFPLGGFVLLGLWLRLRFLLGSWVFWVCLALGIISAVSSFRQSLKTLDLLAKSDDPKDKPPISFNDHT